MRIDNASITGSLSISGSFVQTGPLSLTGPLTASAILANGTITAQTLIVSTISSSIEYSSGSNILGSSLSNTQQLTGSVSITGSLTTNGTGTFSGTNGVDVLGSIRTDGASNGLNLRNGFTATITNPNNNTRDIRFDQDTTGTVMFKANGNVGIGTSSPSDILDVQRNQNATTNFYFRNTDTTNGSSRAYLNVIGGTSSMTLAVLNGGDTYIAGTSGKDMYFQQNIGGTVNMIIRNGGSVGIGTSSPVTSSNANVLQIGNNGIIENVVGNQMMISNNAYYNAGWKYVTTANAAAIRFGSTEAGDISFHSAASGTAGGSISNWDTSDLKMYIKPNGNVGIGTSAPNRLLQLQSSEPYINLFDNITSQSFLIGNGDSSIYITNGNNSATIVRITSGGNVLIGTTSDVGYRTNINQAGSQDCMNIASASPTANSTGMLRFGNGTGAGTYIGDIRYNGTGVSYLSASDERLKKNIIDAESQLNKILSINVRRYDFKENNISSIGFIAQELFKIAPEAVAEGDYETEIVKTWAVDNSKLVPALVKAIQEQQAQIEAQNTLIQDLLTRIQALENK